MIIRSICIVIFSWLIIKTREAKNPRKKETENKVNLPSVFDHGSDERFVLISDLRSHHR